MFFIVLENKGAKYRQTEIVLIFDKQNRGYNQCFVLSKMRDSCNYRKTFSRAMTRSVQHCTFPVEQGLKKATWEAKQFCSRFGIDFL